MNHITIDFTTYKFKRFPKIKIYVDDDLIEEIQFDKEQQLINIPVALEDGNHLLEIEHFDKTSRDTQIKDGKIVADTKFTIRSVVIDKFDLPSSLMYLCEFTPNWKDLHRPIDFPDVLPQSFTIGPNGTWKLEFETPIENWLIKNKKANNEKLKNIITYESYEISPHSVIDYILTEKDHKLIKEIKELLNE